jgi:hypothetical protein
MSQLYENTWIWSILYIPAALFNKRCATFHRSNRKVYICIFHYLNVCAFHYHYVLKLWTKTSLFLLLNNAAGIYSILHIQVFSYNCDIFWLSYLAPLICLFPKILKNIWFSNLLILSVRDEGYSGNVNKRNRLVFVHNFNT